MKKARLIAGMTAAIPAAVAFAAPAAAHATQATMAPAQRVPAKGKTVSHPGIQLATFGPQWAVLSESETFYPRSGGHFTLADGTQVYLTCYYSGAPYNSDPYWDHITKAYGPRIHRSITGHLADRHVDIGGAAHLFPYSVVNHC